MLEVTDIVGITFWIISVAMVASTAFFFLEANSVSKQWATSVRVAGLITLIAAVHYYYMRAGWVETATSPTVYRYIDWLLTVPLQMVEFYLILAAVGAATSGMFWRLLLGSLVMLVGGYLGEAEHINKTLGFIIGMAGWVYILYEVFSGEAGRKAAKSGNKSLVTAFGAMRMIGRRSSGSVCSMAKKAAAT